MIVSFFKNLSSVLNVEIPSNVRYILSAILFLIISISAALLHIQYKSVKTNAEYRLSKIAEIKIDAIKNWAKDQIDDTNILLNSEIFNNYFNNYLKNQDNNSYFTLGQFLIFYAKNNDIKDILIVNKSYSIIFSISKTIDTLSDEEIIYFINKSASEKKIIISDIHYDSAKSICHISTIAPLFLTRNSEPLYFLVFIYDVNDYIFNVLSQWTGISESAETLLIQHRSSQIYTFYPDIKNPQPFALDKYALSKNNILYKSLQGKYGFISGIDNNRNNVLAFAINIPELSWTIITKQNRWTLFNQWYLTLFLASVAIMLSIAIVYAYIIIYTKNSEKFYYQKLYQEKSEQLKQSLQYKLILESIGDAIIVTDSHGNIEIFNYVAELLTGWQAKEVIGRYVGDVLNIFNTNILHSDYDIFQAIINGHFYGDYHTSILLSKNNTVIPIDFKGTVIKNHDENILGTAIIIQDQTKESFFYQLSDIRISFINYSLQHSKEEFIHYALNQIIDITNSQVACLMCYKYYYNFTNANDLANYRIPDPYITFCIDDTIGCSIDYSNLWNECMISRKPIIHNTFSQYFNCRTLDTHVVLRELFIPVFRNDKLVAIIGVANNKKDYSEIDISKLMILADIVFEILLHKENEETYKNLFAMTNDLVCVSDINTATFLLVNPSFEKVLGYTQEELLSKPFTEFIHPEDIQNTKNVIQNELQKGKDIITFENRYRCKDGSYRWLNWNSHPIPSLGITYATAHDVTERKTIEESLRKSEEKFKNLFIHANDGICLHELVYNDEGIPVNYKIIDVNPQYEVLLSLKKDDVIGKLATEAYATSTPPYFEIYKEVALTGVPKTFETYFEPMNKYFIISVFSPEKGKFATVFKDITEIKIAAKKIEESEEKFSLFMKNLPLVIVIRDVEGRYVYLNDEWERVMELKKKDWLGKSPYNVFPKEDAEKLLNIDREAIAKGKTEPTEFTLHYKSGIKWWIANSFVLYDTDKRPAYVASIYIDITKQKKAEEERDRLKEQLIQAQKLESIGRLAGGVAHDYNNMLEVILGNAQLALMQIDNKEEVKTFLNEISNAAKRSAEVTRQLLTFARKQITQPQIVNLNVIIENMMKMLRRLIGENIDLRWHPYEGLWNIMIDPSQINQVVANLCINARDAIESNGIIILSTQNILLDEMYCANIPDCLPGEYVLLTVTDNGSGIDNDILDKIFDPFFTTKEVGKGTGLGLSTVYGIVKQNNGFIKVYSEKGVGSTFKIFFPRHSIPETTKEQITADEKPLGKGETLLVVEDEESLLRMIQIMLQRLEYKVISASSPSEAIQITKEKGSEIDLLLTDLVMPKMNGVELYEEIKKINPDIKCLFMSGYTDIMLHEHIINKETNFLQKPFSILDLSKKLRFILEKK